MGYADLSPIDISRIQAQRDRQFLYWTNRMNQSGIRLMQNAFIMLELTDMGIIPQSPLWQECLEEYQKTIQKT